MPDLNDMLAGIEATLDGNVRYYGSELHGLPHLREVALLAGEIAVGESANVECAMVAGFLHDIARKNDFGGSQHALDSAKMARPLIDLYFPDIDAEKACYAIQCHADGLTSKDPVIGAVWDADRLTLRRLGRKVQKSKLSTKAAVKILETRHNEIVNNIRNNALGLTVSAQIQYCVNNGYLLHGSPQGDIDVLRARKDKPCCATNIPIAAMMYGMSPRIENPPQPPGGEFFYLEFLPFFRIPKVKATDGWLKASGRGYVYVVESEGFRRGKDATEYATFEPVKPIACIEVKLSDLPCKIERISKFELDYIRVAASEKLKDSQPPW